MSQNDTKALRTKFSRNSSRNWWACQQFDKNSTITSGRETSRAHERNTGLQGILPVPWRPRTASFESIVPTESFLYREPSVNCARALRFIFTTGVKPNVGRAPIRKSIRLTPYETRRPASSIRFLSSILYCLS